MQRNDIVKLQLLQPPLICFQWQSRTPRQIVRNWLGVLIQTWSQPNLGLGDDRAGVVTHNAGATHARSRFDIACAQLRASQIHGHEDAAADLLSCSIDVVNHAAPLLRAVVGAVDASEIHTGSSEALHQLCIIGGLGGQGHHNVRSDIRALLTEQLGGVVIQGNIRALIVGNNAGDIDI